MTDARIKEIIDGIDFSQMVSADDLFYLIARAVEAEALRDGGEWRTKLVEQCAKTMELMVKLEEAVKVPSDEELDALVDPARHLPIDPTPWRQPSYSQKRHEQLCSAIQRLRVENASLQTELIDARRRKLEYLRRKEELEAAEAKVKELEQINAMQAAELAGLDAEVVKVEHAVDALENRVREL